MRIGEAEREDVTLLAWMMEEGAMRQGIELASRSFSEKSKKMFPPNASKKNAALQTSGLQSYKTKEIVLFF